LLSIVYHLAKTNTLKVRLKPEPNFHPLVKTQGFSVSAMIVQP